MWSIFLLPLFVMNFLVHQAQCQVKMVLFYGTIVTGIATNVTSSKSVGDCRNGCFEDEHCFLMYFRVEKCYFHSYLNTGQLISVVEVHKSQWAYVAFKTDISNIPNNTCPESYKDLKFSVTSFSGEKYSWIKTSGQWKFANCRTGWKRFERKDETVVCMKVFPCISIEPQSAAITRCVEQNVTLTGIASLDEAKWVQEYKISNKTYPAWIGGARDCPEDSPCTIFKWTDGYTNLYDALNNNAQLTERTGFDNCLAILPPRNNTDAIIFSQPCGYSGFNYVCGYKIEF
ncbi:CW domain-containing protein [Caenorhabditis elegans]|uniref:CW domain-containing protein n=1 Tax=Caenorhabditis elegans TaxID=6239 RepID=O62150_CAEEL|nr:CW domain-containing protein [Caenorhabditis elegans]CAB04093.2 CW domain-containing protein [Caenorhabditis elegans]|eukprot:NP_507665.2 C-type LECtin [Caenorhabditis elegans]